MFSITHTRRYHAGRSVTAALEVIGDGRATQFDPELVDLFLAPPVIASVRAEMRAASRIERAPERQAYLFTIVFIEPGFAMLMMPAHAHMHFASDVRAGFFVRSVIGFGGTQGAGVTGTHGIGAPSAEITAGFVGAVHMPNGMMFTIGM